MNEFTLLGRTGKITLKYTESGSCYCNISIGIPNGKVNSEGKKLYDNFYVTFFNTQRFNTAERLAEEVKEGEYIRVHGKLTENVYTPPGSDKPLHSIKLIGWGFAKVIFDKVKGKFMDVSASDVKSPDIKEYGEEEINPDEIPF